MIISFLPSNFEIFKERNHRTGYLKSAAVAQTYVATDKILFMAF